MIYLIHQEINIQLFFSKLRTNNLQKTKTIAIHFFNLILYTKFNATHDDIFSTYFRNVNIY
jgi:hypothetical protein